MTVLSTTTCLSMSLRAAPIDGNTYSLNGAGADDYDLAIPEASANGNITQKYYKLNFKPANFTTTPQIVWQALDREPADRTGTVAIQLPILQNRYFRYIHTPAAGQTVFSSQQTGLSGNVNAAFINSSAQAKGGAINNLTGHTLGNINANFTNNHSDFGGAIYNTGDIGLISGDFIANNTYTHVPYPDVSDGISNSSGGAIYNSGNKTNSSIQGIRGNFIGNHVTNPMNFSFGGAIHNSAAGKGTARIGDIDGSFVGNYLSSDRITFGGAIYNGGGVIGNITGDFIANYGWAKDLNAQGGAIYNDPYNGAEAVIGDITGNFIGNFARSDGDYANGGAIANLGSIGKITGNFIGNHAETYHLDSLGGALWNDGHIDGISGDFVGNYTIGDYESNQTRAGAMLNSGTIGYIRSSFFNNYALTQNNATAASRGGAVFTSAPITFNTAGKTRFFSGNYTQDNVRGKNYNAIYVSSFSAVSPTSATLDTSGGGAWIVNDNIEGGSSVSSIERQYDFIFRGDDTVNSETGFTTQYIALNNDIVNAGNITVENTTLRFGTHQHEDRSAKNWDGRGRILAALNPDGSINEGAAPVTSLHLKNAVFDLANGYQETVKLNNYSADNGFVHIDVDPDNMSADVLDINGNVIGVTNLIVHATSATDIRNRGSILFAKSANDTTGNEGSFVISRVYKSPYLYNIAFDRQKARDSQSHTWEFAMNDEKNPDENTEPEIPDPIDPVIPDVPVIPEPVPQPRPAVDPHRVAPEVIAYDALPAAAIEQTRSMVDNIAANITKVQANYNLWAHATYDNAKYDAPVKIDADIWGIEAGGDLQHDLNNKLGVFVSYRRGKYDMSGRGDRYYSPIASKIDIDSYLGGLYYRYDRNNWWGFATLYGGVQKADLKSKDGIKSDGDGTEFGGSLELGYDYALNDTLYLTPSLGAYYTQVNYDNLHDAAGKTARYNDPGQVELEAGIKMTKAFYLDEGYANAYVKPSVVQTLVNGEKVKVSGLDEVKGLKDQTLGRVEIGGRWGFTEQLSAYAWANCSFGDDYHASAVGLGLNYAW